ncbi:MAG: VOC family protein [Candidatus Lernaella stagnicola]|nr:VOC family protein [Candidatus Lernaella stagnicola]
MSNAGTGLLIWLSVSDLSTANNFYTELLGLKPVHVNQDVGWAELLHPGCGAHVGLRLAEKDEIIPAGGATLTFDVNDLENAVAGLERKGVTFITGVMNLNGYSFATFVDPDGNILQLRQVS